MYAKTMSLLLIAGVLTAVAYADDASTGSVSTPNAAALPSGVTDETDTGAVHQPTVSEVILSDYRYGDSSQGGAEPTRAILPEGPLKADSFPIQAIDRRWFFGITPGPIVPGDPSGPAAYFPSVTFRFDPSRSRHS